MLSVYTDERSLAWDFASKKAGHDFDRETDEKITDGARNAYEKYSGYVLASFTYRLSLNSIANKPTASRCPTRSPTKR